MQRDDFWLTGNGYRTKTWRSRRLRTRGFDDTAALHAVALETDGMLSMIAKSVGTTTIDESIECARVVSTSFTDLSTCNDEYGSITRFFGKQSS
jgi:uncharacterized membrane protein YcaP (DUF421 family)